MARVGGGHLRVWRVRRLERRRTRSGGRQVKFSSIDRPITLLCVHVPCRGGSLRRSRAHRRRSPIAPDVSGCMRGGWPPACAPALRQPAACPNAMALPGRVHTRTSSRASLSLQTPWATVSSLSASLTTLAVVPPTAAAMVSIGPAQPSRSSVFEFGPCMPWYTGSNSF